MLDGEVESPYMYHSPYSEECVLMNKSDELTENINSICEHVGCDSKATSKVALKVGPKGTVLL